MPADTPLSRRRLLQSGAALGTLTLAGCSGGGSSTTTNAPFQSDRRPENTPTETETPVEYTTVDEAEPTAIMGEVVADEKLALVVMKTERKSISNEDLVLLELQIKNRTTGEYLSFQNMRMHLIDDEGNRHPRRLLGQDAGAEVNGEQLAPGELVWSRVLFQAPPDASGLKAVFTFDSAAISFDQVTIDLGETSESVTTFEQSLDVVTYDVGETVSDDGLSVTLEDVRIVEKIEGAGAAGKNMVFVIPKVSVVNETGEPQTIRTISYTSLKDGRGRAYGISEAGRKALSNGFPRSKQIAPGNTRTGEIPYAVPAAVQSLFFVFDFSIAFGGFRRFWEL